MILFETAGDDGEYDPEIQANNKINFVKEGGFYKGELKGYGKFYSGEIQEDFGFHGEAKVGFFNEGNYLYGLGIVY